MLCKSCETLLKNDASFCGNCGAKVTAGDQLPEGLINTVSKIDLDPCALDVPSFLTEIISVSTEVQEDEEELMITIKYQVTNNGDTSWNQIDTSAHLISQHGQLIEGTTYSHDNAIAPGETVELEINMFSVFRHLLKSPPEGFKIILNSVAYASEVFQLEECSVPLEQFTATPLQNSELAGLVKMMGAGVWKTKIDSDNDCWIYFKALAQNLSDKPIKLKIDVLIQDKRGKNVAEFSFWDWVIRRPCNIQISRTQWPKPVPTKPICQQ